MLKWNTFWSLVILKSDLPISLLYVNNIVRWIFHSQDHYLIGFHVMFSTMEMDTAVSGAFGQNLHVKARIARIQTHWTQLPREPWPCLSSPLTSRQNILIPCVREGARVMLEDDRERGEQKRHNNLELKYLALPPFCTMMRLTSLCNSVLLRLGVSSQGFSTLGAH